MEVKQLDKFLLDILPHHSVIAISGAPGVGKSQIVYQVCEKLGYSLHEVRLYEEGETAVGLPKLDNGVTIFAKPYWFDYICKNNIDVLFLDDFHLVVPAIQKYLYKLLTHRMLHHYQAPENVKIIIAGNFKLETADASEIQSPIMSRIEFFVHYTPDLKHFARWALSSKRIDPRIVSYLRLVPDDLYVEDPPTTAKYPCPRTWEMLSNYIQRTNSVDYVYAIIGDEAGARFVDFWNFLGTDLKELLSMKIGSLNDQIRIATALAYHYIKGKQGQILEHVSKFNPEAQFLFASNVFIKLKDEEQDQFLWEVKDKARPMYDGLLEIAKLTL